MPLSLRIRCGRVPRDFDSCGIHDDSLRLALGAFFYRMPDGLGHNFVIHLDFDIRPLNDTWPTKNCCDVETTMNTKLAVSHRLGAAGCTSLADARARSKQQTLWPSGETSGDS